MALDDLSRQIDAGRAKAAALNMTFVQTSEDIRSNRGLSPAAIRQRIAKAYVETRSSIEAVRGAEAKLISEKALSLQRQLFGTYETDPSSIIAFRDAQDRAERLESPQAAKAVLHRALMTDDRTLASAILSRAVNDRWHVVVDQYNSAHPEQVEKLSDLQSIIQLQSSPQANVMAGLQWLTPKPKEFAGATDTHLGQVASNDLFPI
jgi:hypothetical protein